MQVIDTNPLGETLEKQKLKPARLVLAFIVVVLGLTFSGIVFHYFNLLELWLFLCFVVVGVLAFGFFLWSERVRNQAIKNFALLNGLEPVAEIIILQYLPPSIQSTGTRRSIKNSYSMLLNDRQVYMFDLKCNEGRTTYFYSVALFQTIKNFPHIFLDGRKNGKNRTFKSWQKLQLEGDFNNHFDLYLEKGAHIETLSLLSPDVMQTLVDSAELYDVEIYGNHIALITWDTSIYTKSNMDRLLDCLKAMLQEVRASPRIVVTENSNLTSKPSGLKRRSRIFSSVFAVIVIVIFICLQIAAND